MNGWTDEAAVLRAAARNHVRLPGFVPITPCTTRRCGHPLPKINLWDVAQELPYPADVGQECLMSPERCSA